MPRMYEQLPVSIQQSPRVPLAFKQKIFSAEWLHHKIPLSKLPLRSVQSFNTSKNTNIKIHHQKLLNILATRKVQINIFAILIQRIASQVFLGTNQEDKPAGVSNKKTCTRRHQSKHIHKATTEDH